MTIVDFSNFLFYFYFLLIADPLNAHSSLMWWKHSTLRFHNILFVYLFQMMQYNLNYTHIWIRNISNQGKFSTKIFFETTLKWFLKTFFAKVSNYTIVMIKKEKMKDCSTKILFHPTILLFCFNVVTSYHLYHYHIIALHIWDAAYVAIK